MARYIRVFKIVFSIFTFVRTESFPFLFCALCARVFIGIYIYSWSWVRISAITWHYLTPKQCMWPFAHLSHSSPEPPHADRLRDRQNDYSRSLFFLLFFNFFAFLVLLAQCCFLLFLFNFCFISPALPHAHTYIIFLASICFS